MHVDLDEMDAAAPIQCRYCIVGAGIAGLILARCLASKGFVVTILEAGGLEQETRTENLLTETAAATTYTGTFENRFRIFGGSSTRWGGQLLPFTADVFAPVAGSPSLSWPIREADVSPYYDEIQRILHVGALPFTEALLPALGHASVPLSPDIRLRFSKWIPFNRRNFAQTFGREFFDNPRIQLFTHATVASLKSEGERITSARVLNDRGHAFDFQADHFIMAAGTIESSRILLASPGVPNQHDQLGRYFHDHVAVRAATLSTVARCQIFKRLGPFVVNGVLHTCKLEAVSELQRDQNLLSVMAHIIVEEPDDTGITAVRNLLVSIQQGKLKEALSRNFLPMLRGADDVVRLLWASKMLQRRAISKQAIVGLNIDMGQPANPNNRIRLSENRDSQGLEKSVVDWRIGAAEYETAAQFGRIIQRQLHAAGFPPLDWVPGLLDGIRLSMSDTYHPMGGLRMGVAAQNSVVDKNLKVHGLDNLHVASCAVYPSGGSSNPTFTLIALAMRLGDHLAK